MYDNIELFNDSDSIDSSDYWIIEHNNDGGLRLMRRDNSAVTWGSNLILQADGNVKLGTGNLVIGTAGQGITFGGDPDSRQNSPSVGDRTLYDYEEGTWTPTVTTSVTSGSITNTYGNYTKIGNTVSIRFLISGSGMGITGFLLLTNLPFTVSTNGTGCYGTNDINSYSGETFTVTSAGIYIKSNGSTGMTAIEGTSTYYTS